MIVTLTILTSVANTLRELSLPMMPNMVWRSRLGLMPRPWRWSWQTSCLTSLKRCLFIQVTQRNKLEIKKLNLWAGPGWICLIYRRGWINRTMFVFKFNKWNHNTGQLRRRHQFTWIAQFSTGFRMSIRFHTLAEPSINLQSQNLAHKSALRGWEKYFLLTAVHSQ